MKNYTETKSEIAAREYGDCVVRSLAVGFGISYDESHKISKEYLGRQNACGVKGFVPKMITPSFKTMLKNQYGVEIEMRSTDYIGKDNKTKKSFVRKFIKDNPHGKFIITGTKHAWVIEDGEVKDWTSFKDKIYREINCVFKVTRQGQLSLF
jgi:hypothetical protein